MESMSEQNGIALFTTTLTSLYEERKKEPDSIENIRSLAVTGCCLLILMFSQGVAYSVAPLIVEWLEIFDKGQEKTGWISSVNIAVMFLTGPFAGIAAQRYGFRPTLLAGAFMGTAGIVSSAFVPSVNWLYITYGAVAGVGFGMQFTPSMVLPGFYFDRHKTAALAITSTGAGIGMLTIPHLLHHLIRTMDWRMTMVILSCIMAHLHIIIVIAIPKEPVQNANHKRPKVYKKTLLNVNFVLLFATQMCWNFGGLMAFVFMADLAKHDGLEKGQAALLISVIGISSVCIRLILAFVDNYYHLDVILLFVMGNILRGLCVIIIPLATNLYWYSILCSIGLGTGFGLQVGMLVPTITKVFGQDTVPFAMGAAMVASGIGSLAGPPVAGRLHQSYGDYSIAFFIGGGISIACSLFLMIIRWRLKRR